MSVLFVGIVHLAKPMTIWGWRKTRAESRGLVFQDSPSEEALAFIRLKGFFYVVLAIGAIFYFATRS